MPSSEVSIKTVGREKGAQPPDRALDNPPAPIPPQTPPVLVGGVGEVAQRRNDRLNAPPLERGVDRVSWTPHGWGGKERPRCRRAIGGIPPEFRQRIVELVRKGPTPEELSRHFDPSTQAIRAGVRQAARDAGERTDGLTTDEREEVRRVRRAVTLLREERAILARAAAWLARETGSIPSKESRS